MLDYKQRRYDVQAERSRTGSAYDGPLANYEGGEAVPESLSVNGICYFEVEEMKRVKQTSVDAYLAFTKAINYLQSPLLLVVRLYWGWQFVQTGWGKLQDIPKVVDFFTSLGLPFPTFTAYLVGVSECVGGIMLFVGLGSRAVSVPLAADMLGAYLTADREALRAIFSDPSKFYAADPFSFLFAALVILAFGPGKLSLDALIAMRIDRSAEALVGVSSAAVAARK